jgi:iron complex transport system permease protein
MKPGAVCGGLLAALVAVAVLSAGAGESGWYGPGRVLASLRPGAVAEPEILVIRELRLPRVILGLAAGAALGVAGAGMQALFRNPLAEPYVAGVSSGASAGAVAAAGWGALGMTRAFGAFAGALLAVWLVRRIAGRQGEDRPLVFLLGGMAVSGVLQAVTVAMLLRAEPHDLRGILVWLMGSLAYRGWEEAGWALGAAAAGCAAGVVLARPLDLMAVGRDEAAALGVPVRAVGRVVLWGACLLAGVAVATCGTVGYVGLMAPHLARGLVGAGHRWLVAASALVGGLLLIGADAVARLAVPGQELPVGAVTGVLGGLFLCGFLLRR